MESPDRRRQAQPQRAIAGATMVLIAYRHARASNQAAADGAAGLARMGRRIGRTIQAAARAASLLILL